ncbi:OprD family outer membrane porin [Dryocola sp. BD613]|uniref:OprD family outer membrane porin n=1 Tax=Dryocola sp. BD613 TaxID=3133272 RepID=UPI003F5075C1
MESITLPVAQIKKDNYKVRMLFSLCIFFSGCSPAQEIAQGDLLKDSHLDLSLRNHWKYLKADDVQATTVHNAWGQSATLNFRSGYLWDTVGFDVSYSGVMKLGASDYFSTRGLLYNDGAGMDKDNAKGFNKFGQRYIKVKFGDNKLGFKGKAGWQELKNFGVVTASNRLTKNSYFGYSASLWYENLGVDLGWLTRSINRDAPDKVHFQTADRKNIGAILTGEGSWKSDIATVSLAYGEAKDYLRRHIYDIVWRPSARWTVNTTAYGTQALDNYKAMPEGKKAFDNSAWHYVTEASWKNEDWLLKLAAAYTQANKKNAVGYYDRHIAKNMRGRFYSLTSAGNDYTRDGEAALAMSAQYQLTPQYATGLQWNYGQFKYKNNKVRSGEISLVNQWVPGIAPFKNLSVFVLLGYGWGYEQIAQTPKLNASGQAMRSSSLSSEIVIDYKFGLF